MKSYIVHIRAHRKHQIRIADQLAVAMAWALRQNSLRTHRAACMADTNLKLAIDNDTATQTEISTSTNADTQTDTVSVLVMQKLRVHLR